MKGVLLVNLGSPDSPSKSDVKKYLGEFLMDPRVIDLPYLLRAFLVKGVILNTRPAKSAEAYSKVWTQEGSPLIVISEKLKSALSEKLSMPVSLGMRYGSMSIEKGLEELSLGGVTEVLIVPLYPQFAMSTTETVMEKAREVKSAKFPGLSLDVLPPFYNDSLYVEAIAKSIEVGMKQNPEGHLLLSYHGVPERHIKKSDVTKSHCAINAVCCDEPSEAHEYCYRHQCLNTTQRIAEKLGLEKGTYTTAFQSRLGSDKWLEPYAADTLESMPSKGIKNLNVVTPSFVADCLETLEEMDIENRELFTEAGGERYNFIPCLNDTTDFVNALESWCKSWQNENLRTYSIK